MHHFIGDQVFRKGLINFLNQYQNGNADKDDLFSALTKEVQSNNLHFSTESVKVIMDTWTDRPGFPVVHSIADYEKNKLKLFQVSYLFLSIRFVLFHITSVYILECLDIPLI